MTIVPTEKEEKMRLIDANELYKKVVNTIIDDKPFSTILSQIDEAPTIDAEPIVRCKDCRYWEPEIENAVYGICRGVGMFDHSVQTRERNFYCADGEMR